jgi:phenylalanyl-tRNA synthetase alpha chain
VTDSPTKAIDEGLAALGTRFRSAFAKAPNEQALRAEHAKILGKKGELTAVLALMRNVPPEGRPAAGAKVNAFKDEVEAVFESCLRALGRAAREAELRARPFDLSLPGRLELGRGHAHPILQARDDLLAIFRDLGFVVAGGPEIELEENNFTKLAFPPDHPATDMQDSFWVAVPSSDGAPAPSGQTQPTTSSPRVLLPASCSAPTRATCRSAR